MEEKCIRVLHITEMLSAAGIESFIMNVYRKIDRNKVQFDFLVLRDEKEFYEDEINKLGGKKFFVISNKKNTLLRIICESIKIKKFLEQNKYDIVHIHYTTPLRAPYLLAAKLAGVKTRIYHSHSAYVDGKNFVKRFIYSIMRKKITAWGTNYLACSKLAGDWMFEKKLIASNKVQIMNNGILLEKFTYNENIREEYRKKFDVQNKKVIGHVARFKDQKNHTFLIDIMEELVKKDDSYVLWLIGEGELEQEIKNKVSKLKLEDNVKFLGVRDDVNCLMQAMDMFVLPSIYEGLPVVGIEAQASGLKCLFSDRITNEVIITDKCKTLKLDKQKWISEILNYNGCEDKRDYAKEITEAGYSIEKTVQDLYKLYLK